jgi:hypothetical protein
MTAKNLQLVGTALGFLGTVLVGWQPFLVGLGVVYEPQFSFLNLIGWFLQVSGWLGLMGGIHRSGQDTSTT